MTVPQVSIVLATNRNSPFLAEALRSVQAQTMADWELILVDNGIPEPEPIAKLLAADSRMRMITIDSSATAGLSRNVGASQTSGPLVTFLDDDDVWREDRLELHARAHTAQPHAPASYSGYWHMDAEGRRFGTDWRSRQAPADEMLRGTVHTPLGPTVVVRREEFAAIGGFSPEIPILVDFEFALRLALRGSFAYIDELLVGYRRHDRNMTSTASANVRLRRAAMEGMVERQRWAAAGRGLDHTARMLDERLGRFRAEQAYEIGASLPRLLRGGDLGGAAGDAVWAVRRSPFRFLRGLGSTLARSLRGSGGRAR